LSPGGCTVTVRRGPRVERERAGSLRDALELVERRGRELERGAHAPTRSVPLGRSFEPVQQVVARIEVAAPGTRRGGIDVRGDGSAEAYTGWLRRRVVEQRPGESPYDALRRALGEEA
jgi:hypothetical protein